MHDDDFEDAKEEPGDRNATEACPHCDRQIYEDAERCPHCGRYVSASEAGGARHPWWMAIALLLAVLAMIAFLVNWIMSSLPPRP